MQIKKSAIASAVGVLTLAGLGLSTIPAQAFDPVSNSFAIVGSDTLEDVVGALANGSNATGSDVRTTTTISGTLGNFDATGTTTIITKPYGVRFERPNGSGDGRGALEKQIAGAGWTASKQPGYTVSTKYAGTILTGTPIDISRGSSAGTTAPLTGGLGQYTFGRDAIAFAYGASVTPNTNGFIPAADMTKIFQCNGATLSAYNISGAVIPQAGSGTRKDFLGKLGITDDVTFQNGSCIVVGQEHDASTLTATQIMPMSASRWIAMKNGLSFDKSGLDSANIRLGSLVTTAATEATLAVQSAAAVASVSVTSGVYKPVVAYYKDGTWGRDTYLFVDKRRVSSFNPTLAAAAVSGATTVSVSSATGLYVGLKVTGTGVAASTTVSAISGTTVTLSAALTADKASGSAIKFADDRYNAVLAALFSYSDETSLTYQGGTSFSYASMTDANYPAPAASTAAAVKLKFGFLPASVQDYNVVSK